MNYQFLAPESVGFAEGLPVGLADGLLEGLGEGFPDGLADGLPEGVFEGLLEGLFVGLFEGLFDGLLDGLFEGVGFSPFSAIARRSNLMLFNSICSLADSFSMRERRLSAFAFAALIPAALQS